MQSQSEILDLTRQYFKQQAEIYGKDVYVDFKPLTPANEVKEAATLSEFYTQIKDCTNCKLSDSRTNLVFGVGNPDANLMCIGEAPGFDEDKQGEPFVGAAGQLLNKILAAIGFNREEIYIANIVKCRPPQNRNPEPDEVAECMPFLKKQIEMIKPKLILALGRVAVQNLLGLNTPMGSLRGTAHDLDGIKVVVTYHPAALLRNPQWKKDTWEDVKKLRRIYDEIVGDKPLMN